MPVIGRLAGLSAVALASRATLTVPASIAAVRRTARGHAAKFCETPAGVQIVTRAGDVVLMPRALVRQGLYPPVDDDWWI